MLSSVENNRMSAAVRSGGALSSPTSAVTFAPRGQDMSHPLPAESDDPIQE